MKIAARTSRTRTATRTGIYEVRLARDASDLMRALKLRYEVFNVELGEGLSSSIGSGYDIDRFDPVVDHLVVEHLPSGNIVGTYRLQTGTSALEHEGFYSAQEFDFGPYEPIRNQLVELGRACVHRDHRSNFILGTLWKAITDYATERCCRYLIGCSSITTQDPAIGLAAYQTIFNHLAPAEFQTVPLPASALPAETVPAPEVQIPRLLRAYLTIGAYICGAPAIDREFKTIDFLTLMDLTRLSNVAKSRLFR